MSRVPRRFQYAEGGCYHILNRGHNRETVFRDTSDFESFLSLLGRETYLSSCGRYIERNPLEAELVEEPWDYPWSSCGFYALGEANELVTMSPFYTELAKRAPTRQKRWRSFLLGPDKKEETVSKETWIFGDATFRQRQAHRNGRPTPGKRGRPRRKEIQT